MPKPTRLFPLFLTCFFICSIGRAQQAPAFTCAFDAWRDKARESDMQLFEERLRLHFSEKKAPHALPDGLAGGALVVPVVVHIIHDGGTENIPDAQILAAIDHLNEGFAAAGYFAQRGATVNTQIQFCLAKRDPDGNATAGITRTQSPLTNMVMETEDIPTKNLSRWNPKEYVNIWVVKEISSQSLGSGVAGYAYFPSSHGQPEDGMICEARTFGVSPPADAVLIHEMGHYFGLYHTFEGGCKNDDCSMDGDRVCDTPPDQARHTSCPYNSCSTDVAPGSPFGSDADDFTNDFMDYSPFTCYCLFTAGQALRMQGAVETARASLLKSKGCHDPCTLPLSAAFSAAPNPVFAGQQVVFTNTSSGASTYSWSENGSVFSQNPNPARVFNTVGNFAIALNVTNTDPNCSDTAQVTIQVQCPVTANFSVTSFEIEPGETLVFTNTSTGGATSFEWSINGQTLATSTDFSYLFSNSGYYSVRLQAGGAACSKEKTVQVHVKSACGDPFIAETKYAIGQTNILVEDMVGLPDGSFIYCGRDAQRPMMGRLDAAGKAIWHKVLDVSGYYNDIEPLPDGNFVLHGQVNTRFLLAKIDDGGNIIWFRTLQNPETFINAEVGINCLAANPDGSFAFFFRAGNGSGSLGKMAADGTVLWIRRYQILQAIGGLRRATDGSGDYLISTYSGIYGIEYVVMRINQAGDVVKIYKYALAQQNITSTTIGYLGTHPDGDFSLVFEQNQGSLVLQGDKYFIRCQPDGQPRWAKKLATMGHKSDNIEARYFPGEGWLLSDHKVNADNYLIRINEQNEVTWQRKMGPGGFFGDAVFAAIKQNGLIRAIRRVTGQKEFRLMQLPDVYFPIPCLPDIPKEETVTDVAYKKTETTTTVTPQALPFQPEPYAFADAPLERSAFCSVVQPCPEFCDNELDDDGDGYVDCFDNDCPCFDPDTACTLVLPPTPIAGKIKWASENVLVHSLSTPFIGNLNPQIDDIPEIVVSSVGVDSVFIFRGDGQNKSNPTVFHLPGMEQLTAVPPLLIDINADGIPEMLVPKKDGRIAVFTNYAEQQTPPLQFWFESAAPVSLPAGKMSAADFDQDGVPEIYVGNQIFGFDFSNPAAPTLTKKLQGNGHYGAYNNYTSGYGGHSTASDMLSRADCNGDPDCDGLELVGGANIYSIDLDPADGDGLEIKVQRNLNAQVQGQNFKDGHTQVADINLDGQPDVVVNSGRTVGAAYTSGVYAWDKNGLITYFQAPPSTVPGWCPLTIANVFDDKKAGATRDLPEIIATYLEPDRIATLNLNAQLQNPAKPYWWQAPTDDQSTSTFFVAFDFDRDGFDEIVTRGDTSLRVLYGGPLPLPAAVDPLTRAWFKIENYAPTHHDGPAVADVDHDGTAEIVYTCHPFTTNWKLGRGTLRVLTSANLPWPDARPVWNQYNYYGVHINDDLTVPKTQQKHWLEMGAAGSGKRPFNTYRGQVAGLHPNNSTKQKVPDLVINVDSTRCQRDSFDLFLRVCNLGSADLPTGTSIAFYLGNPTTVAAPILFPPILITNKLAKDNCTALQLRIPATYNQPIFAVVNDDGSLQRPFNLATAFPSTDQPECHYENNMFSFSIPHQTLPLNLGPDTILCKNSVIELSASPNFQKYRWQDGSAAPSFTAYSPGKYWVDAYDACGFKQSDTLNIVLNTADTLGLPDRITVCAGETVQLATTGFSKYTWSPADSLSCSSCAGVDILVQQPITVHLTAARGDCIVSDSVHIDIRPDPLLDLEVQADGCDTTVTITAGVLGEGPFQFLWSNFSTGANIAISQPGTYTVGVTDKNGCHSTDSVAVLITPSLALSIQATAPGCANAQTGAIDLMVSGGRPPLQFLWSNNTGAEDLTALPAGVYTATVTDANGCSATITETLSDPAAIQLALVKTDPNCAGAASGALALTAAGGTGTLQVAWSNNAGPGNLTALPAGVYSATVADANGCTATITETLNDPPALQLALKKTDPNCAGAASGALELTAAGGTGTVQVAWSNNAGPGNLTALPAGVYTATIADANGCTATITETLNDPPALQLSLKKTDPNCAGAATGALELTAAGGTGTVQVAWSNNAGAGNLTALPAGVYTATVTDAHGCTATITETLIDPPALQVSLKKTDPGCAGAASGALELTAGGGTGALQVAWSNNTSAGNLAALPAGVYTATVADANGCTATITETLNDPPALQLALKKTDPGCAGAASGALELTAAGGTGTLQVAWSNNAGAGNLTALPAGVYTATVADANGCTATIMETLNDPPALHLSLKKTDPGCAGAASGALELTAGGGTGALQVAWSNNAGAGNLTALPAGVYTATVTDANGCTATITETLNDPPALVLALQKTDINCPGDSGSIQLTAGGGAPPFIFLWSNNATTKDINIYQPGFYEVTTTDSRGCTRTANAGILMLGTLPVLTLASDTLTCKKINGVLSVQSNVPNTAFLWSGPGGFFSTAAAPLITANGLYAVTATEPGGGCTTTGTVAVPADTSAPVILLATHTLEIPCGQASMTISAAGSSGGPGFSVQWTASFGGSILSGEQSLSPTIGSGGLYEIALTNLANGCTANDFVDVVQADQPVAVAEADSVRCFGETNGVIRVVSSSGALAPLSYSLDHQNFQPDSVFKQLAAGVYQIFIRDANGCLFSATIEVGQPAPFSVELTGDSLIVAGAEATLQAVVKPVGFVPAQIDWIANGVDVVKNQFEQSVALFQNTRFQVDITDPNGCSASDTWLVRVDELLRVYAPNAIFPENPAGANQTFLLFAGANVVEIESLNIFDRWGNEVFSNRRFQPNDESQGWNGRFRGQLVDAGVFIWVAKVVLNNGTVAVISGDLTVLR